MEAPVLPESVTRNYMISACSEEASASRLGLIEKIDYSLAAVALGSFAFKLATNATAEDIFKDFIAMSTGLIAGLVAGNIAEKRLSKAREIREAAGMEFTPIERPFLASLTPH